MTWQQKLLTTFTAKWFTLFNLAFCSYFLHKKSISGLKKQNGDKKIRSSLMSHSLMTPAKNIWEKDLNWYPDEERRP
jgi:hypothetical protein